MSEKANITTKNIELKDLPKESKTEKALRLGSDDVIAQAIQTLLKKDNLA